MYYIRQKYLAVLLRDNNEKAVLGVFEWDSISSRYEGNAEQSIWKVVKLQAGTAATRKGRRCLFFGGIGMPGKMKSYAFTNSGVRYSCPAIAQQEQRTK